ncbi:hypothetical protein E4U19_001329 [Claviceps sp. Clav32 group G5]|nr:hypothetical protein E4U19_001329 [Claviceps sp. Clav32 group G5]KAG6033196.1 hypothetical protein E4U40_005605 [Claviceps sp. LM458 group G5]KAG6050102.1 hypothetical protein E4U39_004814 [Claviceps sp. Clav50 group G5]
MTPPCHAFPASDLPSRIQVDVNGRRRKQEPSLAGKKIDLSTCELLRMVQYKCDVEDPSIKESPVLCFPVERLFRRCKDRNGPFLVETTAWEGSDAGSAGAVRGEEKAKAAAGVKPFQWSTSWADADVAR